MFQSRETRFGRGGVILRAVTSQGLSDDEIAARAPSVFAESRHESRSERYTYIPTRDLLGGLRNAGLVPMEVRQGGSKSADKRGFTKHLIRLRPITHEVAARQVGDLIPEVTLLNSHDGTSAYAMAAGIFRLVCLNGLTVPEQTVEGVRVPHKGDVMGQVIEGAYRVLNDAPMAIDRAMTMQSIMLSAPEETAFARAASALRFDENQGAPDPDRLLRTRRIGDRSADLWTTFNRVQENIVRGGIPYETRDINNRVSYRSTRPVQSIDQDRRINQALWVLADEMAKLKAA